MQGLQILFFQRPKPQPTIQVDALVVGQIAVQEMALPGSHVIASPHT